MKTIGKPINIEVLLHCYYRSDAIPKSPATQSAIYDLLAEEAIRETSAICSYTTTLKGDAWVKALMATPPPKLVFIDPRNGKVLP